MARFYDVVDRSELARIEAMLKDGGIEYSLSSGADDIISEIMVAEEDLAYAESLLVSASESPARQKAGVAAH